MKGFAKIIFLVLLVLPIWLTIVALAESDLLSAWRQKLSDNILSGDSKRIQIVEISPKGLPHALPLASQKFTVSIPEPRENGFSTLVVQQYGSDNQVVSLFRLQAKLFIEEKIPVATRRLDSGQRISLEDVEWQWRDASTVADDYLRETEILTRNVRGVIQAGDVITGSKTSSQLMVQKGDRVSVIIKGEGMKISGVGIAEQSGSFGQSIKVHNVDSKKEIVGVVTAQKVVEVRL